MEEDEAGSVEESSIGVGLENEGGKAGGSTAGGRLLPTNCTGTEILSPAPATRETDHDDEAQLKGKNSWINKR